LFVTCQKKKRKADKKFNSVPVLFQNWQKIKEKKENCYKKLIFFSKHIYLKDATVATAS
jgi:hypothetical protein